MEDVHVKEEELSSDDSSEVDERKLFLTEPIKIEYFADSLEYINDRDSQSCKKPLESSMTIANPFPIDQKEIQDDPLRETKHTVEQCNDFNSLASSQPGHSVQGKFGVDSEGDVSSPRTKEAKDELEVKKLKPGADKKDFSLLPRAQTNTVEILIEHDMMFGHFIEPTLVEHNSSPVADGASHQEEKCKRKRSKHSVEKIFECDECKQKFSQKGNLNVHKRIHTGEKRFECDQCPQKFWQKFHLKVHLRVHTGEKPYECDVCHKRFSQKSMVTVHKRLHTGEKSFECDVCKQRFSRKFHLQLHSRVHTGEQPFQCADCNQKFTQKSTLIHHERKHAGVTPYECGECNKRFTLKSRLKIHLRSHSGERPFHCDKCEQTFLQRSHLNVHLLVAHQATGKLTFECVECKEKFRNERHLQDHVKIHRVGQQPVDSCEESFLREHLEPSTYGVREETVIESSSVRCCEKPYTRSNSSATNS